MRSYRLYENVDPEADISGEDFDLVSQVNESMMLDQIFEVVKKDIIRHGVGACRSIRFIHEQDMGFCMKNYYDMVIILRNLVSNAIQSQASEIEITTDIEDGKLLIRISDNGKGIDPKEKPYLFTPHFSTRDSGTKEAGKETGLGFYNVRKAIINSRGTFAIDSKPGEGTTCVVSFPLREVVAGKDASCMTFHQH